MNKQFLRSKKEYRDLKNFWLDANIANIPLDPKEYPCVIVYNYICIEERFLVNHEFVYSKDFFPTQN